MSLLTREGEVEIAKRIEDGVTPRCAVIVNPAWASQRSSRSVRRSARAKLEREDVVRDLDEERSTSRPRKVRALKVFDKVKR